MQQQSCSAMTKHSAISVRATDDVKAPAENAVVLISAGQEHPRA